uniref:eS17 SR0 n=1 Tax=Spraguea lophii (strain 42_110) TaxID=1358809 RepID=UPI0022656F44|nr:Chain SR0, eS17 SR0 [Spraguea lophii 42_110]7QJH_RR0 Chain RR0, eS17 [Spraguea lophii 42_110]7QJH_SR0 Chain SR0, eS17 [Spraguea lophii 42_110]8BR3_SR0 Chain SR0, eS17 [Spraguea lophii 42_110]8P5D_SR0 Chain SR0, eS17 [Spraguea lophii 42_110]8P60_RR0 Chain RR0, 40S ribosomal protein S17 [Spraguea lophii 42_110]8P60_SR0 Chain SR0, 40S ribosomal protein S17 [Spraguea lophii 42_110]
MGQIKGKSVRTASKVIVERYFNRLTNDFYDNRNVVIDVAEIRSKKLRNKVSGCVTKLYKRVKKNGVPGLYIKEHEEEREKKESFIPKISILDEDKVEVDEVTMEMINQYEINGDYVLAKK